MKTLQVYYIKQFLSYTGLSLVLSILIFLSIDILENYQKIVKAPEGLLGYMFERLPDVVYHMQVVSFFFAFMVVLSLMMARKEFVTLATSGIRTLQVVWPLIVLTGIGTLSVNALYDQVVPELYQSQQVSKARVSLKQVLHVDYLDEHIWYRFKEGIYRLGHVHRAEHFIQDVQIILLSTSFHPKLILKAKEAVVFGHSWHLRSGRAVAYEEKKVAKVFSFVDRTFILPQSWQDVNKISLAPEQLSIASLWQGIRQNQFPEIKLSYYRTTLYHKLVFILLPFVLLFVGWPLIVVNSRNVSLFRNAVITAGLAVSFWIVHQVVVSMGLVGKISPLLAVVSVPSAYLLLGGTFWLRKR